LVLLVCKHTIWQPFPRLVCILSSSLFGFEWISSSVSLSAQMTGT
jgi:hypothetical protein